MWWCANQPVTETNSITSPDQPSDPSLYSSWVAGGDGSYQHHPSWFSSPDAATSFPGGSATLITYRDRIADGDENVNGGGMIEEMFEKPLTPSDVGKLNRLVIPKQHAEKHFPLGDGNSGDKGMLLSFEDDSGKQWRFRYSYWNSSQSYVFTKGWSRFVKEKRLDAGDVVLFQRHRRHCDRLFIGWRRRPAAPVALVAHDSRAAAVPAAAGWASRGGFYSAHPSPHHPFHHHHHHHQVVSYHHHEKPVADPGHCPNGEEQEVAAAVGRSSSSSNTNSNSMLRRVRLFGVNLECLQQPEPDEDELRLEPSSSDLDGSSSFMCNNHDPPHSLFQPQAYSSSIHHPGHMDVNFPRDVNQR